jgi:hypothetical protein
MGCPGRALRNSAKCRCIKRMFVEAAYRYRCNPTPEQANVLNRTFGCVRVVYNHARAARASFSLHSESFLLPTAFAVRSAGQPPKSSASLTSGVPVSDVCRHPDRVAVPVPPVNGQVCGIAISATIKADT